MKIKLAGISILLFASSACAGAVSFDLPNVSVSGGVGAAVPDNADVESAVVGKVDGQLNLNQYLSFGLSVGQTGEFKQQDRPEAVKDAEANPGAFAARTYHPIDGDIVIIDNSDNSTTVNVLPAPDKLPARPRNLNEKGFWFAEPYIQLALPIKMFKPYVRAFIGGSGVKNWGGSTEIGLSKGVGGGVLYRCKYPKDRILFGIESMRRFTDAGHQTYGSWQHVFKAEVLF